MARGTLPAPYTVTVLRPMGEHGHDAAGIGQLGLPSRRLRGVWRRPRPALRRTFGLPEVRADRLLFVSEQLADGTQRQFLSLQLQKLAHFSIS